MKRFTILSGLGMALFLVSVAYAAIPQLINFQGILKDGSGNPVANGSYSVIFTIYDAPSAGNVLWAETTSVSTTSGLFSVLLGSANPVPDSAFQDTARYLGVKVGADPEMTPRQKLVSVGYAYESAQWTSAAQNLFRLSGNVGIGTNIPLGLLHLKGSNYKLLLESSGNADVVIGRADATRYGNYILADGDPSVGANNRWAIGLRNGDSKLHLYDEVNSSNVMVLQPGGNVGIGTASPAAQLHVHDPINSILGSRLMLTQAAGGSTIFDGLAVIGTPPKGYLWNYENGPLIFGTNDAERLRIDSAGNVGVGIDAPAARLQVGLAGIEGTPPFIAGTQIVAQATNGGNWAHMAIISSSSGQSRLNFGDASNDDQGSVAYNNFNDAMFFITAAAERMRITNTGNVGIGTSAPNSRLQVNGALATAVTAITVNSTLNESHSIVLASTPGVSDVVITLPTAVGIAGRQYTIKKADAAAHTVVVDANGAETIDGAFLYNLTAQNKYVTLVSNGANWFVIANN
ncbi:MAG: hypothetical protein L0196_05795 [candidate division Zixibacteria bacterium]|nr:hypothetical protein [candidate division Zixibacteria bacterium]